MESILLSESVYLMLLHINADSIVVSQMPVPIVKKTYVNYDNKRR